MKIIVEGREAFALLELEKAAKALRSSLYHHQKPQENWTDEEKALEAALTELYIAREEDRRRI